MRVSTSDDGPSSRIQKTRHQLLNQGLIRFQDVFWGKGPDPVEGVRVLHDLFLRHLGEAEDLISLIRVRVGIEEVNASRLVEMGRLSGGGASIVRSTQPNGFGGNGGHVGSIGGNGNGQSTPASSHGGGGGGTSGGGGGGGGGLFNSITALAFSVATNISTTIATIDNRGPSSPRPGSGGLGSGNISAAVNPGMGSFQSASASLPPTDAQSQDAASLSAGGANGFTQDASSLLPVIRTLREQMMAMAAVHRRHADTLTLNVLAPLTAFVDQNRRLLGRKKAEVDAALQQFKMIVEDIEGRRVQYFSKTKMADEEEERFKKDGEARANPPKLGAILFGSRSIPLQEFHDIVNLLKREIKTKGILTPVGLFEGCFLGEDALALLQLKYPKSPRADIRDLCQEFVTRRCISPVVGGVDGKFSAGLPYTFGRPVLKTGEQPHIRARKDADIARLEYEASIGSSETARTVLEQAILEYLSAAQEAETFRLTIAGGVLKALEEAQIGVTEEIGTLWGNGGEDGVLQVPEADGGIQHIATRYRTGHLRIPPVVFESYEEGHIASQTFGVSLDDLVDVHHSVLPLVVLKCVGFLAEAVKAGEGGGVEAWMAMGLEYGSIAALRSEMNKLDEHDIKGIQMSKYNVPTVAMVLRMYLVELPVSVCSWEIYEGLKAIYEVNPEEENAPVDANTRFESIKSLLKTLTPPHHQSLRILATYLSELVTSVSSTSKLFDRFCWSIAPLLIRPRITSRETLADEMPFLFTKDLLLNTAKLLKLVNLEQATIFPHIFIPLEEPKDEPKIVETKPQEEDPVTKERKKVKRAKVPPVDEIKALGNEDFADMPIPPSVEVNAKGSKSSAPSTPVPAPSTPNSAKPKTSQDEEAAPPNPSIEYDAAAVVDSILANQEAKPDKTRSANWMPWSPTYSSASSKAPHDEPGDGAEDEQDPSVDASEEMEKEEQKQIAPNEFKIMPDPNAVTIQSISAAVVETARALTADGAPLTVKGAVAVGDAIRAAVGEGVVEAGRVVRRVVKRHEEARRKEGEARARLNGGDEDEEDEETGEVGLDATEEVVASNDVEDKDPVVDAKSIQAEASSTPETNSPSTTPPAAAHPPSPTKATQPPPTVPPSSVKDSTTTEGIPPSPAPSPDPESEPEPSPAVPPRTGVSMDVDASAVWSS
ncbi:hypothetical protein HDU97_006192 [Phlyctochytrium planicorne]|nr:hypothetical protein HDU97_006192 [Phlyctochytrium planicorne]